ncbi:helix-turn-helix transcriptional regulator, partial [Streptomyces sp. AcH 505]
DDVGLIHTRRRRTSGLRREEVAALADMSTDYYSRIEQQRGPLPSVQILASLARALRLGPDERDHLFRIAGRSAPGPLTRSDRVNPGMLRVLDRMSDSPAHVTNHLGEILAQNRLSALLIGDQTRHTGMRRSLAYRWFTDPAERRIVPERDRSRHSRTIAGQLRTAGTRHDGDPATVALVDTLRTVSGEFAALWDEHPVAGTYCDAAKHIEHPRAGLIELHGENLLDPDRSQFLTVFTAEPGSESQKRLEQLALLS